MSVNAKGHITVHDVSERKERVKEFVRTVRGTSRTH